MTRFSVPDMSCGHCSATIEQAIRSADPAADVTFDLQSRIVSVTSGLAADTLANAIRSAGYEPSLQA